MRKISCQLSPLAHLYRSAALISCLTLFGCHFFDGDDDTVAEPGLQGGTPADTSGDLAVDALQPPNGLNLTVSAAPGVLDFSWSPIDSATDYALIATNRVTTEGTIIADGLNNTNEYSHSISAIAFDWAHTSIALQACDTDNVCVQSVPLDLRDFAAASLQPMQTTEGTIANRFGQSTALIDNGQLLVITEPGADQAHLYSNFEHQQNHEQTLELNRSADDRLHVLKAALSATGDSVILASWSASEQLQLHVFDRLGPTWIETDTLSPALPNSVIPGGLWQGSSLEVVFAADGNSMLVGLQGRNSDGELIDDVVLYLSRTEFNWQQPIVLPAPELANRLSSLSASSDLSTAHMLAADASGELSLHHYTQEASGEWIHSRIEALPPIPSTEDVQVQTSTDGHGAMIGAWEVSSTVGRSPVLWALDCADDVCSNWLVNSSIRLPPTKRLDAVLKMTADGRQSTALLGWQSDDEAVVSVLIRDALSWTETLPLPYFAQSLSGTRFISDMSLSRNGNTAVLTSLSAVTPTPASEPGHVIIVE